MSYLNRLIARIGAWFRRAELDQDLDQELQTHLALLVEENVRRGLSPEEARRRARLRMGNVTTLREAHRETRGLPLFDTLLQDLRYTFRILRRDRGFAFFAILIVALGIGASTIVFSVLNTLLLRPLPFKDAEQLVWIANKKSVPEQTTQVGYILDARQANNSFTELAAYFAYYSVGDRKLTGDGGDPERLTAIPVTQNFFHVLGVEPQAGRFFNEDECRIDSPATVVLTDSFWKRRFTSNPDIIGKTLQLNGQAVRVVGVAPASFDFTSVFAPGSRIDLFSPFPLTPETDRMGNTSAVVGRLKPGVTLESAQAEFDMLGARFSEARKSKSNEYQPILSSLKTYVTGRLRLALIVLASAVGLVMIIVCANLSNLLLARNTARQKEIAIRVALGAGRRRLIRQMLTESIVLSGTGAVGGVLVAVIGTRILTQLDAIRIPLLANVQVDLGVLAFTLVMALVTGLTFGLIPALQVPAIRVNETLKDSNRGSSGRKHTWLRSSLVVTEVAFACLLLVGTGLLIRSFLRVLDVDLGFQPERLATLRIDPSSKYSTQGQRNGYFDEALRLVQNTPGVEACGLTDVLPLEGDRSWGVAGVGQVYDRSNYPEAFVRIISNGYFKTMGIPLLAGRDFTEHDTENSEQVIIINDTLARRLWPGQNAVGQMVTQDGGRRVVGVVGGVRHLTVEQESGSEMYLPIRQTTDFSAVELVVRTSLPEETVARTIRAALNPLDPNLGPKEFRRVQQLVDKATSPRRFVVMMLAGFSGFALILAALGIYAVISYSVQQRTQEIGIRMALGASARNLQAHIILQTLVLAGIGLIIGLAGSLIMTRSLAALLFGVNSYDPASFIGTVIVLVLVATIAGYFPARRASQIDPINALRSN